MTTSYRLRVLIVHESPTFRYDLMGMLAPRNYQFFQANSGLVAVQSAQSNLPDIILMSARLPDMSGVDCLRRIKSNTLNEKTRVILMQQMPGGPQTEELIREAYRLGCSDFVSIPIVPAALELRMEKLERFVRISATARNARDTMAGLTLPRPIRI
jgi:PleD family two-component response regulator